MLGMYTDLDVLDMYMMDVEMEMDMVVMDPKMRMVFSYPCSLDDPWVGYIGCHFSSTSSTSSSS